MKLVLISATLCLIVIIGAPLLLCYVLRDSQPVIACTAVDDSVESRRRCLMNPFRDRQPELQAEEILRELKNGNTDALIPYLKDLDEERKNRIMSNERQYPIEHWEFGERGQSIIESEVVYWVTRKDYPGAQPEKVAFLFKRAGNEWKLRYFTAVY
ncbi:MAG TPA: hypothetical protein VIL74_23830 [Pyrinomonadaceae bacterium]|jgi:hypothetical protein